MGEPTLRFVIIDDEDNPGITFEGEWTTRASGFEEFGSYSGIPYRRSQRGTNTNSSLSFTYHGSDVHLIGTLNSRNVSGHLDPDWQCYIDDNQIEPRWQLNSASGNYVFLCSATQLDDAAHTLTANITSFGRTFWVDQVQYVPSPDLAPIMNNATVIIGVKEPTFRTTGVWSNKLNETVDEHNVTDVLLTQDPGATASLDFIGTKLSAYGWIPRGFNRQDSKGTYSIDSGPQIEFVVPGLHGLESDAGVSRFNQVLFETGDLPPGPHRLVMVYEGSGGPLTLDYAVVENGDIVIRSPDPSTIPNNSSVILDPTPSSSNVPSNSPPIPSTSPGAIAGGVVGGFAILFIAIFLFVWWRRRRLVPSKRPPANEEAQVDLPSIVPFDVTHPNVEGSRESNERRRNLSGATSAAQTGDTVESPLLTVELPPAGYINEKTLMANRDAQRQRQAQNPFPTSIPATAATVTSPSSKGSGGRSFESADGHAASRPVVVTRHEDSGLRGDVDVVDLPPLYSVA